MLNVNPENSSPNSLDELDMQIIEQLKLDARQSIQAIAQSLGVSRETVRNHLNKLISEDELNIVCVTRSEYLGYEFTLIIGVRTRPGYTDTVAKELGNLPGVLNVSLAGSHFNILVWATFRNRMEFANFVSKKLTSVSNIISFELMRSFNTIKLFWRIDNKFNETANSFSQKPLDDLDSSIIKAIKKEPRQTITALANTVGCSRIIARTRLEELIHDGVIGFMPLVNRSLRGYNNWVMILIKSEPDKLNAVIDKIAEQDTTWNVSLISGQWQVYAMALFKDSRAIKTFATEIMNSIPGITEFEIIPIADSLEFLFPPMP